MSCAVWTRSGAMALAQLGKLLPKIAAYIAASAQIEPSFVLVISMRCRAGLHAFVIPDRQKMCAMAGNETQAASLVR